jgi:uncharacterized protein
MRRANIRHAFAPAAAAILAAGCTAPQAVAADASEASRTIVVNGEGEASAAPDMAIVTIGVSTDALTAADALRQNSANMKATIDRLKKLGVAERDIQTSGLSVNPRYDYESNRSRPEVIGFTASNNVTVRLRKLDSAGSIIDEAVQSGANTLSGISFGFSDPKPLLDEARRDAVESAKEKASLLTDAAGVRLGRLINIQEGYAAAPQPKMYSARMEAADASVPLEAGESSVNVSVSLTYEIE